jgi:hypothetical protein
MQHTYAFQLSDITQDPAHQHEVVEVEVSYDKTSNFSYHLTDAKLLHSSIPLADPQQVLIYAENYWSDNPYTWL